MTHTTKATVIIADADEAFSDSLEAILNKGNYIVTDKIPKRKLLVNSLLEKETDILIVDYELSQEIKGDTIVEIRRKYPLQKLLLLTYYANLEVFEFCMEYRVNGFEVKGCSEQELFKALATIMDGGFALPIPHKTEAEMLAEKPPELNAQGRKIKLTLRDMQILKFLLEGQTHKQIGNTLFRSESDIDSYYISILEKVGVSQLSHLLSYATNLLF
jgi:DNA-binding NarL/FixJ family response regulator